MFDSVTVSLFITLSLKVVFLFRLSQNEVSSEFSSTLFNLLQVPNFEIFSFPFFDEIGSNEENVKLLLSFFGFFSEISFLTRNLLKINIYKYTYPTVLHICFLPLTYYYRIYLVFCQNLQFSGILSTQDYLLIGVLGHAF